MNNERMKKLAGLNEGTAFKNGKFKLDRYKVGEDVMFGGYEKNPNGDWCDADDVAGLEDIAGEMYSIIQRVIEGLERADRNYRPFNLTREIERDMKRALKKAQTL